MYVTQVADYAFVQLDRKVTRPKIRLSQAGLPFSAPVTLFYVDQAVYNSQRLIVKKASCSTSVGGSILDPDYVDPQSPTVAPRFLSNS